MHSLNEIGALAPLIAENSTLRKNWEGWASLGDYRTVGEALAAF
jgi:hypothetical protein